LNADDLRFDKEASVYKVTLIILGMWVTWIILAKVKFTGYFPFPFTLLCRFVDCRYPGKELINVLICVCPTGSSHTHLL